MAWVQTHVQTSQTTEETPSSRSDLILSVTTKSLLPQVVTAGTGEVRVSSLWLMLRKVAFPFFLQSVWTIQFRGKLHSWHTENICLWPYVPQHSATGCGWRLWFCPPPPASSSPPPAVGRCTDRSQWSLHVACNNTRHDIRTGVKLTCTHTPRENMGVVQMIRKWKCFLRH